MSQELVGFFNGAWVPVSEMLISIEDRGFVRGDTVFDAVRTFNGALFRAEEHLSRLYRSLEIVRIDCGLTSAEMLSLVREAVERNRPALEWAGDFQVWIFVTRGVLDSKGRLRPTVGIRVSQVGFKKFLSAYTHGWHAIVAKTKSVGNDAIDPRVKHYNRMNFSLAELEVWDSDASAVPILTDSNACITEGTAYNVFAVIGDELCTPPMGRSLEGVTARATLQLAQKVGLPAQRRMLYAYDLHEAVEIFLTGTSPCLLPITKIDGVAVGDGGIGPWTSRLFAAWQDLVGVDIIAQARLYSGSGT